MFTVAFAALGLLCLYIFWVVYLCVFTKKIRLYRTEKVPRCDCPAEIHRRGKRVLAGAGILVVIFICLGAGMCVWQSRALFFTHEVSSELHRAFAVIGGLAAIFVYFAFVLAAVFLSTVLVLFSVGLVLVWTCERMMANNETIPEYIASIVTFVAIGQIILAVLGVWFVLHSMYGAVLL